MARVAVPYRRVTSGRDAGRPSLRIALGTLALVGFFVGRTSDAWSQGAPPCNERGAPSEQVSCVDRQRAKALEEVVAKTNAFISIATVFCAHNVYAEWQDSLKPLASVWDYAVAKGSPFSQLARTIEIEILESRFVVADAALRNGGRYCRKYAGAEYRQILQLYRDPAFAFARDRAKVGIDDVRALPKMDD